MNEYSKLAQNEYKSRHDWVGKVIIWELRKRLEFVPTNERYMHKIESLQENLTQNSLGFWDTNKSFFLAKRLDLV